MPVSGGDTGGTYRLEFADGRLFLKLAAVANEDLLTAEADGLEAMRSTATVYVPEVVSQGSAQAVSWLALEWLALESANDTTDARLGVELARLHRIPQSSFGWNRDNRIGHTVQPNPVCDSWLEFFSQHRLGHQLRLARAIDDELDSLGERLLARVPDIIADHEPQPSLLHGDLWSGNKGRVGDRPVVFDPAVYCGDREADLAMTSLFGGFSEDFYTAYHEEWPLPAGYERRMQLYQLYHVLNHVNLFGSAYLGQAHRTMRRLLEN